MHTIRTSWFSRTGKMWLTAGLVLAMATAANAADRVNVMSNRQVRPGVSLPVFTSCLRSIPNPVGGEAASTRWG
jgi:hypothetical protein